MIELEGVCRTYHPQAAGGGRRAPGAEAVGVRALRDLSLRIGAGEFVAIVGPSGSGKSTLLHTIGFLDRPDAGSYRFLGREVTGLGDDALALLRNRFVGFVFQQFHLLSRATVRENVVLPLVYAGRRRQAGGAEMRIRQVGLEHRAGHRRSELSGGEQQRAAIARALVNEPLLLLADEPTGNLDSRSASDIVDILSDLNRQGKTVVIVTHEEEIARRARRVIRMHDGRVVEDRPAAGAAALPAAPAPAAAEAAGLEEALSGLLPGRARARAGDHVRQAFRAMTAHKMRSALSMLGILIGVGAVIAMLAVTQGARDALNENLSRLGSNLLMVRPGAVEFQGVAMEAGAVTRFGLDDLPALAAEPAIRRVAASVMGRAQVVRGGRNCNTMVLGTTPEYAVMRDSVPRAGRFFTPDEVQRREKLAVLGPTVAGKLFGEASPLGEAVRIDRVSFTVIGVMPAKGGDRWRDFDDMAVVPVTTAMYRLFGKRYVDSIDVEAAGASRVEAAKQAVYSVLARRHRITEKVEDRIMVRDMTELKESIGQATRTMSRLLGTVAAISLVVGGIGVMNIMLVSVTERTREIGLRKALGARRTDIMTQFLVEAAVMTFSGGVFGVAAGVLAAAVLAALAGWPVRVAGWGVGMAVGFSIAVGTLFGLWPARQASRLDPIEALRYE